MTFAEILQKALQDREFATRIVTDPEGALDEVGVAPTPEKLKALKEASHALVVANFVFGNSGGVAIDNI